MANKENKTKSIKIRVTEQDFNRIKILADLYSKGNISKLILYCVLNFKRKFLK